MDTPLQCDMCHGHNLLDTKCCWLFLTPPISRANVPLSPHCPPTTNVSCKCPPERYLSPTPPISSASVPLEPYLSPSPPISSASVPLKRYPSPHSGYLVPLVPALHAVGHPSPHSGYLVFFVPALHAVGHLSPHSGYLVPFVPALHAVGHPSPHSGYLVSFVPALHAVGHPSPHSGYLVSFVPTLRAVGHTSPPPPVLWETGVPQVPPNPRRVSIVRHWPRRDLVVGTSRWQRQGSARWVSDGELRKLTKKNIGAGSQDGQNANIRSKEKPTPLALLVLIGPLQRQGSARQVSDGELIEFTKILSMLLVSGEKSLRILGPVWVHGSAAKARGSQEQISPGFCALKSDSEQLRAIYTRRRSKVTPQPQVLDTSSGALLRATERISRPPTASIQLVLARWAPSHERLTPGEVAPRRNLRRHSVIQQSHQSVAVRDLRPRGAHEPAAEPLVAVEGACAGGRILCCWVLLVGGEARRQRAIYTRDPATPSQGGQRAINTRGRRREQTRSGESRPLSRPLSRALIQEKIHKSSMTLMGLLNSFLRRRRM
ncbi:hypothetical protein C8F04DRAFT_1188377 [Mycena alexandri]|uniref:Uncharacterized protein n=1 Tax=Mycena alexandri TaxID=1745969 RepID=A0AAD6WVE3_9AGAR|nr:hypothetical protein C8F04DRAFT_1188377 [Mycena alexandri]